MVVETNLHMGLGIVQGDQFSIRRFVTGIPNGGSVSSAQLTVKLNIADADPGIFQKNINSVDTASEGQVENSGASGGVASIRFDLIPGDTLAMTTNQDYYFDIQVKLASGSILTLERGLTQIVDQVTVL